MDREYQLGLAMAGGATGGAYSAGVMDFFFEALRELENARTAGHPDIPPWHVRLRVLSGTSAGGITAAIGMAAVNTKYDAVPNVPVPSTDNSLFNPFYRAWVTNMDFRPMFDTSDLSGDGPDVVKDKDGNVVVQSFLNANFMARRGLKRFSESMPTTDQLPQWAPEELLLTTTNLRGVPYTIQMQTGTGTTSPYNMLRFTDVAGFSTLPDASRHPSLYPLDLSKSRSKDAVWRDVIVYANATSAFPAVFPAVPLSRSLKQLETSIPEAKPHWPEKMPSLYRCYAVDGGAVSNEPFAICRDALERATGKTIQKDGKEAWGSVVLVDPFPNDSQLVDPKAAFEPQSLIKTFVRLLGALRGQASFMSDELERLVDIRNATQFSLGPVRARKSKNQTDLASSGMGNFAGLLDPKLRAHDFMLGRRNCQRFLQHHFVVDATDAKRNPIFGEDASTFANEQGFVAILPLVGSAAIECVDPEWPSLSTRERDIIERDFLAGVRARVEVILTTYAKNIGMFKSVTFFNPRRVVHGVLRLIVSRISQRVAGVLGPQLRVALDTFQ